MSHINREFIYIYFSIFDNLLECGLEVFDFDEQILISDRRVRIAN